MLARCEGYSHKGICAGLPPCFQWRPHTFTLIWIIWLTSTSIGSVSAYILTLETWFWHQLGKEIIRSGRWLEVVRLTAEVTWKKKIYLELQLYLLLVSWLVSPGKKREFSPSQDERHASQSENFGGPAEWTSWAGR